MEHDLTEQAVRLNMREKFIA